MTKKLSFLRRLAPLTAGWLAAILAAGVMLAGCGVVASAPDVSKLDWDSATILYDRTGKEAYRLHAGENRTPIKLTQVPQHVVDAFLAIEDPSFRAHGCINPRGLARAVWKSGLYFLGLPGGRLEGGSTITQQLARDGWLSQELSMKRKLQEAWVAIQLERNYTKDEILEMYLNQIYFGRGAYGIDAAAKTFLGKEVPQLSLADGALLAGMINGPSYFDPIAHFDDSVQRRNLVLAVMLKQELISEDVHDAAKAEQPKLGTKKSASAQEASHFTDYVITILQDAKPGLAEQYGLKLGDVDNVAKAGLRVYTTMDARLQKLAEQAVSDQMAAADKEYGLSGKSPRPEAAMISMNPKTGEVLAMVGGREHTALLEFNRATDAMRQPGSAIKPFVSYIPALEAGLTPATILDDAPVMLSPDKTTVWPQNYDFKYLGLRSMRYGVEQSINPMAVRALQAAGGPGKAAEFARNFGLTSLVKEDGEHLALALGGISKGTTALELTSSYAAIANMGIRVEPYVISKIEDRDGKVLFEAHPKKRRVARAEVTYLMIDMMKDVIRKGTAYGFTGGFKGWPAAGKTGTTESNRDGWFVGFTPDLVTSVWNGYDNPDNHLKWTAAFVPVKTWNQFMNQAVVEKPADWARPPEVVGVTICRSTGMLPNEACPADKVGTELFIRGTEPKEASDLLVKAKAVQVVKLAPDKKSTYTQWQLWKSGCGGVPVERVFIKRPQARVLHPTEPFNPKYVPLDAKDELPGEMCQAGGGGIWDLLLPGLFGTDPTQGGNTSVKPPAGTGQRGAAQPGTTQPGTTQPGTTQPGTTQPGTTQPGALQPVDPAGDGGTASDSAGVPGAGAPIGTGSRGPGSGQARP